MRIALSALALLLIAPGLGLAVSIQASSTREGSPASAQVLQRGRRVYEANCIMCHGIKGDGQGMAAHMFRVPPRDFRQGFFKFRSTSLGSAPTDIDLLQTVTQGSRWTGMVGRPDLSEADQRAVVQYLKTFSPRVAAEPPTAPIAVPRSPPQSQALMEQGRRLYHEAGCVRCHGERGHGDGPSARGLRDDWGRPTRPSDLTWRPLKRGASVEGIYLTIATGLSGTPMPSYRDALDDQEIWALVYYLESLVPAERRLSATHALGEEPRGWMVVRMARMMGMRGRGMRGPGGMHPRP